MAGRVALQSSLANQIVFYRPFHDVQCDEWHDEQETEVGISNRRHRVYFGAANKENRIAMIGLKASTRFPDAQVHSQT